MAPVKAKARKKAKPEINIQSFPDLMKDLDCPVCLDTYSPPIFQCLKGHSICSNCKPRTTKCPLCKSRMTKSRCYTLEAVVNYFERDCKYKSSGCIAPLKCSDFEDHVKDCEYRPVTCTINEHLDCFGTQIPLEKFIRHLKSKHGADSADAHEISKVFKFDSEEYFEKVMQFEKEYAGRSPVLIRYSVNQLFILKFWEGIDYVAIAVVFIGAQKDADKFKCRIVVGDSEVESKHRSMNLLQVSSFRELENSPNYFSVKLSKKDVLRFATPGTFCKQLNSIYSYGIEISCGISRIDEDD